MPHSGAALAQPNDQASDAADVVERFLVASMIPDPETAAGFMAADVDITFTGGRKSAIPANPPPSTPRATSG